MLRELKYKANPQVDTGIVTYWQKKRGMKILRGKNKEPFFFSGVHIHQTHHNDEMYFPIDGYHPIYLNKKKIALLDKRHKQLYGKTPMPLQDRPVINPKIEKEVENIHNVYSNFTLLTNDDRADLELMKSIYGQNSNLLIGLPMGLTNADRAVRLMQKHQEVEQMLRAANSSLFRIYEQEPEEEKKEEEKKEEAKREERKDQMRQEERKRNQGLSQYEMDQRMMSQISGRISVTDLFQQRSQNSIQQQVQSIHGGPRVSQQQQQVLSSSGVEQYSNMNNFMYNTATSKAPPQVQQAQKIPQQQVLSQNVVSQSLRSMGSGSQQNVQQQAQQNPQHLQQINQPIAAYNRLKGSLKTLSFIKPSTSQHIPQQQIIVNPSQVNPALATAAAQQKQQQQQAIIDPSDPSNQLNLESGSDEDNKIKGQQIVQQPVVVQANNAAQQQQIQQQMTYEQMLENKFNSLLESKQSGGVSNLFQLQKIFKNKISGDIKDQYDIQHPRDLFYYNILNNKVQLTDFNQFLANMQDIDINLITDSQESFPLNVKMTGDDIEKITDHLINIPAKNMKTISKYVNSQIPALQERNPLVTAVYAANKTIYKSDDQKAAQLQFLMSVPITTRDVIPYVTTTYMGIHPALLPQLVSYYRQAADIGYMFNQQYETSVAEGTPVSLQQLKEFTDNVAEQSGELAKQIFALISKNIVINRYMSPEDLIEKQVGEAYLNQYIQKALGTYFREENKDSYDRISNFGIFGPEQLNMDREHNKYLDMYAFVLNDFVDKYLLNDDDNVGSIKFRAKILDDFENKHQNIDMSEYQQIMDNEYTRTLKLNYAGANKKFINQIYLTNGDMFVDAVHDAKLKQSPLAAVGGRLMNSVGLAEFSAKWDLQLAQQKLAAAQQIAQPPAQQVAQPPTVQQIVQAASVQSQPPSPGIQTQLQQLTNQTQIQQQTQQQTQTQQQSQSQSQSQSQQYKLERKDASQLSNKSYREDDGSQYGYNLTTSKTKTKFTDMVSMLLSDNDEEVKKYGQELLQLGTPYAKLRQNVINIKKLAKEDNVFALVDGYLALLKSAKFTYDSSDDTPQLDTNKFDKAAAALYAGGQSKVGKIMKTLFMNIKQQLLEVTENINEMASAHKLMADNNQLTDKLQEIFVDIFNVYGNYTDTFQQLIDGTIEQMEDNEKIYPKLPKDQKQKLVKALEQAANQLLNVKTTGTKGYTTEWVDSVYGANITRIILKLNQDNRSIKQIADKIEDELYEMNIKKKQQKEEKKQKQVETGQRQGLRSQTQTQNSQESLQITQVVEPKKKRAPSKKK